MKEIVFPTDRFAKGVPLPSRGLVRMVRMPPTRFWIFDPSQFSAAESSDLGVRVFRRIAKPRRLSAHEQSQKSHNPSRSGTDVQFAKLRSCPLEFPERQVSRLNRPVTPAACNEAVPHGHVFRFHFAALPSESFSSRADSARLTSNEIFEVIRVKCTQPSDYNHVLQSNKAHR